LFHIVAPDLAFFGEKDYQQLILVQKMVQDLNFPLSVVGVPTVREPDGLALSSRNAYLSPEDRRRATVLHRALTAGAAVPARGPRPRRTPRVRHATWSCPSRRSGPRRGRGAPG